MRYMISFIYPVTAAMKPFLANKGHSAEEVGKMHQAWFKSVVIQVTLWCLPYARDDHFWTSTLEGVLWERGRRLNLST